jgi:hypothetical protein
MKALTERLKEVPGVNGRFLALDPDDVSTVMDCGDGRSNIILKTGREIGFCGPYLAVMAALSVKDSMPPFDPALVQASENRKYGIE